MAHETSRPPTPIGWSDSDWLLHLQRREAIDLVDWEAIEWAYSKCVAIGMENGSMESAMMMDRLKLMLVGNGS